jgi:hypothetical protein
MVSITFSDAKAILAFLSSSKVGCSDAARGLFESPANRFWAKTIVEEFFERQLLLSHFRRGNTNEAVTLVASSIASD